MSLTQTFLAEMQFALKCLVAMNEARDVECPHCKRRWPTVVVDSGKTEGHREEQQSEGAKCSRHHKDLALWCDGCSVPACVICVATTHNGHKFSFLEESTGKITRYVNESMTEVIEVSETFVQKIAVVKKDSQKNIQTHQKEIDKHLAEISKHQKIIEDSDRCLLKLGLMKDEAKSVNQLCLSVQSDKMISVAQRSDEVTTNMKEIKKELDKMGIRDEQINIDELKKDKEYLVSAECLGKFLK